MEVDPKEAAAQDGLLYSRLSKAVRTALEEAVEVDPEMIDKLFGPELVGAIGVELLRDYCFQVTRQIAANIEAEFGVISKELDLHAKLARFEELLSRHMQLPDGSVLAPLPAPSVEEVIERRKRRAKLAERRRLQRELQQLESDSQKLKHTLTMKRVQVKAAVSSLQERAVAVEQALAAASRWHAADDGAGGAGSSNNISGRRP